MRLTGGIQRHRRRLAWLVAIVSALLMLGFFAVPPISKAVLVKNLGEALDRPVTIESVSFNPILFTVQVRGLSIHEPSGDTEFIAFDALDLNIAAIQSLANRAPVLSDVSLERPRLNLIRNTDGSYNFSDLIRRSEHNDESGRTKQSARFSLNNIRVTNGAVAFDDRAASKRHLVNEIRFTAPFISSLPADVDIFVEPVFRSKVNGTELVLKGKTKPFKPTRETSLDIVLEELDLKTFLSYLPPNLPIEIVSAKLATQLSLKFIRNSRNPDRLELSGRAQLIDVATRIRTGEPLFAAQQVDVDIAAIDPIARTARINSVFADTLDVHLRRDADGRLNVAKLKPKSENPRISASDKSHKLNLSIAEIRVTNGKLRFSDDSLKSQFSVALAKLEATAIGLDSAANTPIAIRASALSNLGEKVAVRGEILTSPVRFRGEINASGALARQYAPYYERYVRFRTGDGTVDAHATVDLTLAGGKLNGRIDVTEATLLNGKIFGTNSRKPFAELARATLKGPLVDFNRRRVRFSGIHAESGQLLIRRESDNRINLATHFTRAKPNPTRTDRSKPGEPWVVEFGQITVDGHTVRFEDVAASHPVRMVATSVSGKATNLSTAINHRGEVEGRFEIEGGSAQGKGSMTLRSFATDLSLQVQGVDVIPALPYVSDRVKITIASGRASLDGRLQLERSARGMSGQVSGDFNVTDFRSADPQTKEDVFRWRSLFLGGASFGWRPAVLKLDQIALGEFYSRLIVLPDGRLNVQNIWIPRGKPENTEKESGPAPVNIGRITLQGGSVDFTDRFIKPNYSARLVGISGTVSGLSSEDDRMAEVELNGRLDTGAPAQITGRVNPLAGNLAMDMRGNIKGIELSRLSPYAGKYLGYGIEKGSLSFDVRYRVENRELRAENQITLNQLTLGEKVESPDATKLPVLLGLKLLKDTNGVIEVNVPVSGSIDDPQFSVEGVLLRVITNVIARAVTSPFAFLANLVGGKGELSHVEFEPGRSQLTADSTGRLATLAQALNKRPALLLQIVGRYDSERDVAGLRRARLEEKIKTQKIEEYRRRTIEFDPNEDIDLTADDYVTYLRRAYRSETFPKPRDEFGREKDLAIPEVESLMLAYTSIGVEDLVALADRRADAAKRELVEKNNISADRVTIATARPVPEDAKNEEQGPRADFRLQ